MNFAFLGFSEVGSVFTPKNWLHGLQEDSHLADALGSHLAIHFFSRVDMKEEELDLRRFRGLLQTENSTRKGEQCHEQTRPTHRSFAEKLSGWSELPTRSIPFPVSPGRSVSLMAP
jgi:hypothetical protein